MLLGEFHTKRRNPKAGNKANLEFEGARIQLFQDLSAITLQHRRDLRPLQTLRDRHILAFPFCLQAMAGNRTAYLRTPADLHQFCDTLGIPAVNVPDWYGAFFQPEPWIPTQQDTPLDPRGNGRGVSDLLRHPHLVCRETWRQKISQELRCHLFGGGRSTEDLKHGSVSWYLLLYPLIPPYCNDLGFVIDIYTVTPD